MRVTLTVTEGPNRGKVFSFENHDLFLVGRSPETHFSLPDDPYFSRVHFLVEINPPLCRLTDLRSRNGTLVNGERSDRPRDLHDGDEIQAGQTRLGVSLQTPQKQLPQARSLPAQAVPVADGSESAEPLPVTVSCPPAQPAPAPLLPGYVILEKLGEGGMGVVYKAQRTRDNQLLALKTIRPAVAPDEAVVARFLREAEILKQLQHPHIVSFLEMGQASDLLFLAMEFVPGQNLADLRRRIRGVFPVGRAVRLVCQLLEALAYAHDRGFVHRDIKPRNVLVVETGGAEMVKLADFGLARTYQASPLSGLTLTGTAGGTPQYMPPEQVRDFRTVRPTADQYAAAATLYYLLTGQTLYPAATNPTDLLLQILSQSPTPVEQLRGDLPAPLARAIGKALARSPEERFGDVGQFRQVLEAYLGA